MPSDTKALPGRRWYTAGCVVLLVFATVHAVAALSGLFTTPTDPAELALTDHLKASVQPLGPFRPTAWGLVQILNLSYSLLLYFAGALAWYVRDAAGAAGRLRGVGVLAMVLCVALFALAMAFSFPPPAVFALAGAVCFGVAALRATPASSPAG